MKKLLSFLLALALFLPAAFAAAESAAPGGLRTPGDFPQIYFGSDPDNAFKYFNQSWNSRYSFSKEATEENSTLSNGVSFTVLTYPSVQPRDEFSSPMTAKFYYQKGALFAAVQSLPIPEGVDVSKAEESFTHLLEGTRKGWLNLEEIGICAELLGEAAHLQNGQTTWYYTLASEGGEGTAPVKTEAVITFSIVDGVLYLAEFQVEKANDLSGKATVELNLTDLNGFSELDIEQKNAVRLYAQYLLEQQKATLEQYVNFVKAHP